MNAALGDRNELNWYWEEHEQRTSSDSAIPSISTSGERPAPL
jgi:hypothetical protein